jgi:hypothetical protein
VHFGNSEKLDPGFPVKCHSGHLAEKAVLVEVCFREITSGLSAPGTGISAGLPDIGGRTVARTDEPDQSSFVRPRSFLEKERCDFSVSRRTLEPSVGRLGRRVLGTTWARAISLSSRARASARLASCVRCSRAVMINTPSRVARLPANARRRCRTSSGSEGEWPISKRSWTAVDTLLTFWPPGPDARTKVVVNSESGMKMGKCYFQNSP